MSTFEGKSFHMVNSEDDLDYVTGGAKVSQNVDENCKEKSRTQMCDCGKCKKREPWMTLKICDNCVYATAKNENSGTIYCSADRM